MRQLPGGATGGCVTDDTPAAINVGIGNSHLLLLRHGDALDTDVTKHSAHVPAAATAAPTAPQSCMAASWDVGRADGDAVVTVIETCGECWPVLTVPAVVAVVAVAVILPPPCTAASCGG